MPSSWIARFSEIWLALSVVSAVLVLGDMHLFGRRQKMAVMAAVWPLTMLYWGPVGLVLYGGLGRAPRPEREPPLWAAAVTGATHCGAGCALGDFIGDWLVFALGLRLFGSELGAKVLIGFALAYLFGIAFQYFSVAPMRGLELAAGLKTAIVIDTASLIAYELDMFAAMAAGARLWPELDPTHPAYWLRMQAAMLLGFATTYPVNWWLIRRGIKEKM